MRNAVNLIAAVNNASTAVVSENSKKAAIGFAKTFRALDVMFVLYSRDTLGLPVEINDDPNVLAPYVSKDSAYKFATGLMDEAKADLQAAGTASFPFTMSRGYDAFDTPASFIKWIAGLWQHLLHAGTHRHRRIVRDRARRRDHDGAAGCRRVSQLQHRDWRRTEQQLVREQQEPVRAREHRHRCQDAAWWRA
jgi:hypothetical protein